MTVGLAGEPPLSTNAPPPPSAGTISRSGKFTPALPPAVGGPSAQTPAEALAALQEAVKVLPIGSNTFRIGSVELDKLDRTVTLPARIRVRSEVLEYALVTEQGKTHESLLATQASPIQAHLAFVLLGVGQIPVSGEYDQATPVSATNAVEIEVAWETAGRPASFPLADLISLVQESSGRERRPLSLKQWLYNGSVFDGGGFAAQREGSFISLIRDPAALVNNPGTDRDNDRIHFPNTGLLPPEGSPVRVIFHLPKRQLSK